MDTMICLVSKQTMPNVIPVLMYKPKNVILVSTAREKQTADHLARYFISQGIKVFISPSVNPYNQSSVIDYLEREVPNFPGNTVLNLTGGTKLMALAAFTFGVKYRLSTIYCDTDNLQIHTISPEPKTEPFTGNISVSDYLAVHGYSIVEAHNLENAKNYIELFKRISKNQWFELLTFIKKIRTAANLQKLKDKNDSQFGSFTLSIETKGQKIVRSVFSINSKDKYSTAEDNPKMLMGTWLEYYLAWTLQKKTGIDPIVGCKIISTKNVENELDVMLTKDYKLHLFSCKSGKADPTDKLGSEALYQIESLKQLAGGTFGKAYLALTDPSYRGISLSRVQERASDLGITVLEDINAIINVTL